MKLLRITFLIAAFALLAYGLLWQKYDIANRDGATATPIGGMEFNRGATTDRYMRKNNSLYDTRSKQVPDSASLDDCPT